MMYPTVFFSNKSIFAVSGAVAPPTAASSFFNDVPVWAWILFALSFLAALSIDLFAHKKDHVPSLKNALKWCFGWIMLAVLFCLFIWRISGVETAEVFTMAYLLELMLSVDNLFVFFLVFSFFKIPERYQHRVLFWGILGAVVTRLTFIVCGVTLIEKFSFMMYVFGAILIITGANMLRPEKEERKNLEKNVVVRLVRWFFRRAGSFGIKLGLKSELGEGENARRFFVRNNGFLMATPLFLALLVIEGTDVVFAVDSIPAVMGLLPREMSYETKVFVAISSNIFAVLGLRSLFFALSGIMKFFHFMKYGLALILILIGIKMAAAEFVHVSPTLSLAALVFVLSVTMALSLLFPPRRKT
ncbi:MAG: TerC/Alx family metal homeostasis membrane protein [Puniceicoccales bacterium]|jgi:tellurite resistance protein TerC|nr:TerC/Alx family metal homeostasis membrane protein [Puniceicoccales bacterium]